MPLKPEEKALLGIEQDPGEPEDDPRPSGAGFEKSGRSDRYRSKRPSPESFESRVLPDVESLTELIEQLYGAGLIDAYERSVHRMLLAVLAEPEARVSERMRAIESLAKLRGLFMKRARDLKDDPSKTPTPDLIAILAGRLGLPKLTVAARKIEGDVSAPKALPEAL